MSIMWKKYIGETRHPLRKGQIVIVLGQIENDPLERQACVVLVEMNNSSTCAIKPTDLETLTPDDIRSAEDKDYMGGLR